MDFDIKTAALTVVIVPLAYLVLTKIVDFLKSRLTYVLEGAFWHLTRNVDQRVAARVSLRQYARSQLDTAWSRYLHVPGSSDTLSLSTDDIYVPLELEATLLSESRYTTENLLEVGNRLLVVGDPGSGKSTLLKSLHRRACRGALKMPRHSQLPVILELKNLTFPAVGENWLFDQIRDVVAKTHGYDMEALFDNYVARAGILVLLDGLDEVSSDHYDDVAAGITSLSKYLELASSPSQVILTMRSGFYQQIRSHFQEQYPITLRVQPFSPSELYDFLEKWPFGKSASTHVNRIYRELLDSPALRDLCTNPLILAMFVASRHHGDNSDIPDTKTRFYNRVLEELLASRRGRQLGVAARTALLEQRQAILGHVAVSNMLDSSRDANVLPWQEALDVVARLTGSQTAEEAELRLREIIRDTGIIQVQVEQQFLQFTHLTFCEFLAAQQAIRGEEEGFNRFIQAFAEFDSSTSPHLRTRLNEVIPFMCALSPPKDRSEALQTIAANTSDTGLIARTILESQAYDHPIYTTWFHSESTYILSVPQENWDKDWMRRLQLLSRVLRDSESHARALGRSNNETTSSFFATLVAGNEDRLVRLFSEYVKNDAPAAFRLADDLGIDLAETAPQLIVGACETPAFLAMAVEKAKSPNANSGLWSLIFTEAGLRYVVVALALSDEDRGGPISDVASAAPRKFRWAPVERLWLAPPTFYTDCLTCANIALREEMDSVENVSPFARSLSRVKAPGATVPGIVIYSLLILPVLAWFGWTFTWTLSPPTAVDESFSGGGTPLGLTILVLGGIAAAIAELSWIAFFFFPYWRWDEYSRLMNLGSRILSTDMSNRLLARFMKAYWIRRRLMPRVVSVTGNFETVRGSDFFTGRVTGGKVPTEPAPLGGRSRLIA